MKNNPGRRDLENGSASSDSTQTVLDWPADAGLVDRLLPAIDRSVRRNRRRRAGGVAAILGLALACGIVWQRNIPASTAAAPALAQAPVPAPILRMPVTRTLSDGSVVQLREGAEIQLAFEQSIRRVILRRGEAHFQVTKNPRRPFVVVAGGVEVRAVGTAFGVQVNNRVVEVLVTEGRVAIDDAARGESQAAAAPQTRAVLDAGHAVTVDADADAHALLPVLAVSAAEMNERLSWRVPRLDLSSTPLEDVLPIFNAHSSVKVVLSDPGLGKLRISGVVRADHPELFLKLLAADFGIRADRSSPDQILLLPAR